MFLHALRKSDGKSEQVSQLLEHLKDNVDCLQYHDATIEPIFAYMVRKDIKSDYAPLVKTLLEAKINPDAQGENGDTFVHYIAADPVSTGNGDWKPSYFVDAEKVPKKLKAIIELCKPDLLIENNAGRTALQVLQANLTAAVETRRAPCMQSCFKF